MLEYLMNTNLPKCKNDSLETISKGEVGWLAGVIEGEGCITICTATNYNKTDGKYLFPLITITNTDPRLIKKVSEILYKLGAIYHYQLNMRNNMTGMARPTIKISVKGMGSCRKVIKMVYSELTCKIEQADTMLEFINHRKGKLSNNGSYKKATYDEQEWKLFERLKMFKHQTFFLQRLQRKASVPITDEGIVRAYGRP